ncbi:MAG: hypothetical protein ACM31O_03880 [Bacteroidota bacterium]
MTERAPQPHEPSYPAWAERIRQLPEWRAYLEARQKLEEVGRDYRIGNATWAKVELAEANKQKAWAAYATAAGLDPT